MALSKFVSGVVFVLAAVALGVRVGDKDGDDAEKAADLIQFAAHVDADALHDENDGDAKPWFWGVSRGKQAQDMDAKGGGKEKKSSMIQDLHAENIDLHAENVDSEQHNDVASEDSLKKTNEHEHRKGSKSKAKKHHKKKKAHKSSSVDEESSEEVHEKA